MNVEDCVLAVTGAASSTAPALLIGGLLLVAGIVVMLVMSRRRRAAFAAAALGMLLVASFTVPATPALAATGSEHCQQGSSNSDSNASQPSTDPEEPSNPTPQPPEPEEQLPDLAASSVAPSEELAAGSEAAIVFSIRNLGDGATSGSIEATIALDPDSGFVLSFDAAESSVTVDGVALPVRNSAVTVTGTGTAADPFRVTTDIVLAPGETLSIAFNATAPSLATASESVATLQIASGTGGGETPETNNQATGLLRAAAGEFVPLCDQVNDKSITGDTDGDGVVDACDLDSDNDGILDAEEDTDHNTLFQDDDTEGVFGVVAVLGDGIPSYRDLDSDNDSVLDLVEGRPLTLSQVTAFDSDRNGIFDSSLTYGENGLLDDLETSPDSGVLLPELSTLRNADGDDKPDFLDLNSNGVDFDLYLAGNDSLDLTGAGFILLGPDSDTDGILDVVDTDTAERGSPGSTYWPYAVPVA